MNYYSKYAKVDGIVLLDCASAMDSAGDIPIVCAGWASENAARVIVDRTSALEEAISHFVKSGITEIGFIGEHLTNSKKECFIKYMKKLVGSYDSKFIGIGDRFADGAYRTMKKMIDEQRVPRALICAYDYLAIGAMTIINIPVLLSSAGEVIRKTEAFFNMDKVEKGIDIRALK